MQNHPKKNTETQQQRCPLLSIEDDEKRFDLARGLAADLPDEQMEVTRVTSCPNCAAQVEFEDGSVGWYEAGWGPMMSETAYFIKDIIGPEGAASISVEKGRSDDKDHHADNNYYKLHVRNCQAMDYSKKRDCHYYYWSPVSIIVDFLQHHGGEYT